jgi:hypothetical protein
VVVNLTPSVFLKGEKNLDLLLKMMEDFLNSVISEIGKRQLDQMECKRLEEMQKEDDYEEDEN